MDSPRPCLMIWLCSMVRRIMTMTIMLHCNSALASGMIPNLNRLRITCGRVSTIIIYLMAPTLISKAYLITGALASLGGEPITELCVLDPLKKRAELEEVASLAKEIELIILWNNATMFQMLLTIMELQELVTSLTGTLISI